MAFKDRFEKFISYFDTDEVSDVEETVAEQAPQVPQQRPQAQSAQIRTAATEQQREVSQTRVRSQAVAHQQVPSSAQSVRPNPDRQNVRPLSAQPAAQRQDTTTTIALKYPRKYEDAQEIVDLLIQNECVLIDFQYMLDAQARRCLDFIDGASKVLSGALQKVGSSMYLLTPVNVVVDIEEILTPNSGQDFGYDFDMKRR